MPVTHAKVSAKSDGGDATLVRPSDWNASHVGAPGDNLWTPGSNPYGLDDEFNNASLDGAWVKVNTARVTWTERADVLSVLNTNGDAAAELHAILKPIGAHSYPLTIETAYRYMTPYAYNYFMTGVMFADGTTNGAGAQVVGQGYTNNTLATAQVIRMDGVSNFNAEVSPSAGVTWQFMGGPTYMRVIWAAANSFHLETSPDGVSWYRNVTSYARTVTPTHFGLYSSTWAGATSCIASYEYIRVY